MDTPSTDWQCKEIVPNKFSVTFRRCSFKAWKDGYCKIHHPDSVKARQEKQRLKYEEERAKSPYMLLQKATERYQQLERELSAEQEKVKQLREAFSYMLGPIDDEKIGWRGRNPPSNDHFSCEFCAKSHLDCTLIEHQDDCPVTIARAILEKTK